MSAFSSFLFARPSFMEGAVRIVDFGNTLNQYNSSETPQQADYFAIAADWMAVGQELNQAASACIGPSWESRCVQGKKKKTTSQSDRATCAR